jgi:hypothetical protein
MRRISYLDNTAPRISPEQRDTAFLNEALNAFLSFHLFPMSGKLMAMREPRHHFALQVIARPITFSMDE